MKERPTKAEVDWLKECVKNFIGMARPDSVRRTIFLDVVRCHDELPERSGGMSAKKEFKLGTQAKAQAIKSASDILKFYSKGKVPHIRFRSTQPVHEGEDGQKVKG